MKRFFVVAIATFCVYTAAYGQEEVDGTDAEVIEILDLLETMDLLEDEDFEFLENVTQMGDVDEN